MEIMLFENPRLYFFFYTSKKVALYLLPFEFTVGPISWLGDTLRLEAGRKLRLASAGADAGKARHTRVRGGDRSPPGCARRTQ